MDKNNMGETMKNKPIGRKRDDGNNNGETRLEERFAAAETRPHFRTPTQRSNKVVLDDRFSSVLTDPRFQLQEKDKYGRKKEKKNTKTRKHRVETAKEDLKSFYVVQNNDKDVDNNEADEGDKDVKTQLDSTSDSSDSENAPDDESNLQKEQGQKNPKKDDKALEDPESRIAYLSALSRGELDVSSSSDDDDSSQSSAGDDDDDDEDGDNEEDPVHGTAGVLDPSTRDDGENDVEFSYDPSPFLVVTNMDWENIRAVDLFSIMSSFAPPGSVKHVRVYRSDFGIERMAQDRLYGPADIWKKKRKGKKDKDLDQGNDDSSHEESDDEDDNNSKSSADAIDINDGGSNETDDVGLRIEEDNIAEESDFDPEKLRAYEASKLKYYFAIVEFAESDHADIAYREVDGMEFEHSSAAVDLRTITPDSIKSVVDGRPLRDEATSIPGSYEPPDFVVSALQQTNVQCTWDQGDTEREKKLTAYTNWQNMDEMDDLKAYLASDASSDEEDSDDSDDEGHAKGSRMRKLLGLDDSDEDSGSDRNFVNNRNQSLDVDGQDNGDNGSDDPYDPGNDDDDHDDSGDEKMSKTIKYIPGQQHLEEKIRLKLGTKEAPSELTPWQRYQEKRKQKRRERRQAARGNKRSDCDNDNDSDDDDNDVGTKKEWKERAKATKNRGSSDDEATESMEDPRLKERLAKEQLELLLAGDYNEELARDYNIRGIQRLEKNKDKKLTGSRKRKEAKMASDVAGTDFKVNVQDDRFKAVLDGSDDRFGIDKTDPYYKDTSAMREILSEQTKRRKKKRQKMIPNEASSTISKAVPVDVSVDDAKRSSGATALSSLVKRMKQRM